MNHLRHIVDISKIPVPYWEDYLTELYSHIKIKPIRNYNKLFVLENAYKEDVIALTLIGFIFKNDIFSHFDELTVNLSTVNFLCDTTKGSSQD
jgi:hypothetical protein